MTDTSQISGTSSNGDHTSVLVRRLIRDAPDKTFTLSWIIDHLPSRSFGVILLLLALIGVIPVISIPARILILVLTVEIMLGFAAPSLPWRWLSRPLPTQRLAHLEKHIIPFLEHLESRVKPRFYPFMVATRRIAALTAFLLTLFSLLVPFPFSNVPPSIICAMMALAYIEHDGLLFIVSFVGALIVLASFSYLLWQL